MGTIRSGGAGLKRGEVDRGTLREGLREVRAGRKEAREAERLRRYDDGQSRSRSRTQSLQLEASLFRFPIILKREYDTPDTIACREYSALKIQTEQDIYRDSLKGRGRAPGRQNHTEEAYAGDPTYEYPAQE